MELLIILYALSASWILQGSAGWKPSRHDWLSSRTLKGLRALLHCSGRPLVRHVYTAGDYRVLANYVAADRWPPSCHETVTYATHATVNFLGNVYPLVERWRAPISVAVFAPGWDLDTALDSISYLRNCLHDDLVREFVSFHVFFPVSWTPHQIPDPENLLVSQYNCTIGPPYENIANNTYAKVFHVLYPINTARNIARDAAVSHFVLVSDIELYPSPNLVPRFLNMVARNAPPLSTSKKPRVFAINIFEVDERYEVPTTTSQLKHMVANGTAILFHKYLCPQCHRTPLRKLWTANISDTEQMDVFHVGKRQGRFRYWEPLFIGTHQDPRYDERMYYEGKGDKMPQVYIMCVLDYDFMILDNAFLCHKPGIKRQARYPTYRNILKQELVKRELLRMYGKRKRCVL